MQANLFRCPRIRRYIDRHRPILARRILERQLARNPFIWPRIIEVPDNIHTVLYVVPFHSPGIHRHALVSGLDVLAPDMQTVAAMLERVDPDLLDLAAEGLLVGNTADALPVFVMIPPELQVARPRTLPPVLLLLGIEAQRVLPGKVVGLE